MKRYAVFVFVFALALALSCNMVDQVAPGGSKLFMTAQPSSISANGFSTLTVSGTRATGAPLPDGTVISFTVDNAGTVTPNPVETHDGQATARFHAAAFSGEIKVTATSGGADNTKAEVTITVGEARVENVFVSANPPTLPLGGGSSQIRAVVVDASGNQLQGIGVQFSTDKGTLHSGGRVLRTNQNGLVTDVLETTEDATVTATALNSKFGDVAVTVGAPPDISCAFTISPTDPAPGDRVNFVDTSTDSSASLVSFHWDFGDSSTASGKSTQHVYRSEGSFTIVHTVTDSTGTSAVCSEPLTVTSAESGLTASFTSSPDDPNKGERVIFDASQSSDTNGTITQYQWNFGDSPAIVTEDDPVTTHVYSSAGTFTVTLTVTDDEGNTNSTSNSVTIAGSGGGGGGGNVPPTCSFSISPSSGTTATNFSFNGLASTDSDGTIDFYDWDFGDTNTDSGSSVNHFYGAAGTYTVTLTVTDDDGDDTSCQKTVTVT